MEISGGFCSTAFSLLESHVAALRFVMPNAPSIIGKGMNPVAFGVSVSPKARSLVLALLLALGETIEVGDDQMNWCVGLSGAAMRSVLPVLEGMTQAGVEAGLEIDARRVAAQVMLGTASMALQTELSFPEIKALTPMETVAESEVAALFTEAARRAKGKIDQLQSKLESQDLHCPETWSGEELLGVMVNGPVWD